jgi:glycosyltransferase involved in cell wall biosynthesis
MAGPGMRIGYDVSVLEAGNPTGVEKVALHLFGSTWRQCPEDEHLLFCRRAPDLGELPDACRFVEAPAEKRWRYGALPRAIRAEKPDIFVSPVAALPGPCGTPLVGYIHECQWRHETGEGGQLRFRVAAWLAAFRAKLLLTSSHFSAADMRAEFGRFAPPVTVTYPANDPGVIDAPANAKPLQELGLPEKPYCLFVSTIRPKKNLELMIRAFARPELRGYQLICAGRIDYPEIPALAKSLGADNVAFVGYQQNASIAALFRDALGFLYLSATEGFGLPVLEAFANDCPALVSRGGSIPEVAEGAGLYVEDNPEAIVEAVRKLDSDQALRAQLIAAGRDRLAAFSWEQSARVLRDALELAVKG